MAYSFITPDQIISGRGALDDLVLHLSGHGRKAMIVSGKSAGKCGTLDKVKGILEGLKIDYTDFNDVSSEPTDIMVEKGVGKFKEYGCDMLIAIGGGSQIDAMKAIALLSVTGGTIRERAESAAEGGTFAPLPFMVAIPTTSGTGSEVTKFTVISESKSGAKLLVSSGSVVPDLAVLDPGLTLSMPEKVTVSTGVDALTHAIESFTSKKAQPLSDTLAVSAVKRIYENIGRAVSDPDDIDAREQMQLAALEAGLSFGNSSTTLVHGMSRPIGAHFHIPHGMSNAVLLPVCLEFIKPGVVGKFAELGRAVGAAMSVNTDEIAADRFVESVRLLLMKLKVPALEDLGVNKLDFDRMIGKMTDEALESGTPANTVREVTASDINELYKKLWPEQIAMEDGIFPAEDA